MACGYNISVLTSTFLHVQAIGPTVERRLWDAGILTWDDALSASASDLPLSVTQCAMLVPTLEESRVALAAGDFRYFAKKLPQTEHWRAAPEFMDHVGFLDIETNGGMRPDDITIIGVYDGFDSRIYVKDRDLEMFERDAEQYALWVTFYGGGFDIPFLRRRFPEMPFDQLHIDLCPTLKRLGFKGGLKKIETTIGISRDDEVAGMSGFDAVSLWRKYRRYEDEDALSRLIAYNKADVENLQILLAFAFGRMKAATGFPGK